MRKSSGPALAAVAVLLAFCVAHAGQACARDFREFMITSASHASSGAAVYYGRMLRANPMAMCMDAQQHPGRLRMVDQEGGRVVRLRSISIPPSAHESVNLGLAEFRKRISLAAADLSAHCVQINLAPVADATASQGFITRDRSYSGSPYVAARFAREFALGMRTHGVIPVWKHYPGHTGDVSSLGKKHASSRYFRERAFEASIVNASAADVMKASEAFTSTSPDMLMLSQAVFTAMSSKPAVLDDRVGEMALKAQPNSLLITDDISELNLADDEVIALFRRVDMIMLTSSVDVIRFQRVLQRSEMMGSLSAAEIEAKKRRIAAWRRRNAL